MQTIRLQTVLILNQTWSSFSLCSPYVRRCRGPTLTIPDWYYQSNVHRCCTKQGSMQLPQSIKKVLWFGHVVA